MNPKDKKKPALRQFRDLPGVSIIKILPESSVISPNTEREGTIPQERAVIAVEDTDTTNLRELVGAGEAENLKSGSPTKATVVTNNNMWSESDLSDPKVQKEILDSKRV